MLLTLSATNFNELLKSLKTADVPRPILTERFKIQEETYYELHIADRHLPDLLKATTQRRAFDLGQVLEKIS